MSAVNAESVFLMDMGDLDTGMFVFEVGDLINMFLIVVLEVGDLINMFLMLTLEAGDLISIAPILAATAAIY